MSGDNGGCLAEEGTEKPETITVTYTHSCTEVVLGHVEYRGLEEVLIPDYDESKHDVYIRKVFQVEPNVELWKIEMLTVSGLSVIIQLSPQQGSTSLGQTAKAQRRKATQYLARRRFQLVEVEFGVQQDIMTRTGRQGKNTSDSSALLPGELYKMRPCIVHSCAGDRVKVIPLTSDGKRADPKQLVIGRDAFSGLSTRYTDKESYALVDILQTVSTFRVHPMRLRDGSFSNNFERNCLGDNDAKELDEMLSKIFGEKFYHECIRLERKAGDQLKELKGVKAKRQALLESHNEKDQYIDRLEQALKELADLSGTADKGSYATVEQLLTTIDEIAKS